jgi:N-acetylglucosamine kinase
MNVLGIDAGGTRTVCLLVDESGAVLGDARGPGANLQSAGELEVEKVLHDVIGRALGHHPQPVAICLGMAGVDRPGEAATIRQILERIGHRAQVYVVNDALIALEAGVPAGAGTVVVAGTGSIAYGRDAMGRAARSGGWGYVLGDEGSGYWLGRLALRAVVRAADGRGAPTAMAEPILGHFGVTKPQDLVRHIYVAGARPSAIAALANIVGAAALAGDATASELISLGGRELAMAAASVAKRLGIEREPVLLAGGTLRGLELLRTSLTADLGRRLPGADVRVLSIEPAHGAVRLARAAALGTLQLPAYEDGF